MKESSPFALALQTARLKPLEYCRAVAKLTGKPYSPVMTSRWISGLYEAPPPAIALAVLLGGLADEDRKVLVAAPPRKKYTRKCPPPSS